MSAEAEQVIQEVMGRVARIEQLETRLAELAPKINPNDPACAARRLQEEYSKSLTEYERLSGKKYGGKINN